MLDSGHCWRGAQQPKGLSPTMGPGPAASAPPLSIVSAASSCSAARGAAPPGWPANAEDAPTRVALTHWLQHPSQGKCGGR